MMTAEHVLDRFTVYVVDPDNESREGIRRIAIGMALRVSTFETTDAFLSAYDRKEPAILVCEMRPGLSGLLLLQQLRQRGAFLPTIFATHEPSIRMGIDAVRGGALDVIAKPVEEQTLWPILRQATDQYVADRQQHEVLRETREGMDKLTDQQRRVLRLWMKGKKNKAIANDLGVSERTVESCRQRIRKQLNAYSRELLAAKVTLAGEFPFETYDDCDERPPQVGVVPILPMAVAAQSLTVM